MDFDGVNTLFGGAGNDLLYGGLRDFFDGGDGADMVVINGRLIGIPAQTYTIDLSPLNSGGSVALPLGGVILGKVELVNFSLSIFGFSGAGQLIDNLDFYAITGSNAADTIRVSGGGSTVDGMGGNDVLFGWTGVDIFHGGTGNDFIEGWGGADQLYGDDGNDTLRGFKSGQAGAAVLDINTASDLIDGGAGNDTIYALHGDTVTGGAGLDTLNFQFETDFAFILDLRLVTFTAGVYAGPISGSLAGVQLQGSIADIETIAVNPITISARGSLQFQGSAFADNANGTPGNDVLSGNEGGDFLSGLAGNDIIDGGAGSDSLSGDDGDDVLRGGAGGNVINGSLGVDTADYTDSNGPVTINLGAFTAFGADASGDTLINIESVRARRSGIPWSATAARTRWMAAPEPIG